MIRFTGEKGKAYYVYPNHTTIYNALEEVAKLTHRTILDYETRTMYMTEDEDQYYLEEQPVKGSKKVLAVTRR